MSISPSRRVLWLALGAALSLGLGLVAACGGVASPPITPTPTRTPRPTPTLTPSPTPTPAWPLTVYVPNGLPHPLAEAFDAALAEHGDLFVPAEAAEGADVQVQLAVNGDQAPLARWVYALVAPFPTLADGVSWADVAASWEGAVAGPFGGRPLLMTADTAQALTLVLGEPAAHAVEIVPAEEIVQRAWDQRPAWGVVPFDRLEPRWKVLHIDGASILDPDLAVGGADETAPAYPLTLQLGVSGSQRGVLKLQQTVGAPLTNRDPEQMTTLVMTGVTALARCTATTMEREGVLYPARDIRPWLVEADITHLSNEVSFANNCPRPTCTSTMMFCASPQYIELIEHVDVDVLELTGNHLLDWGVGAMENSLRMYDERGIAYYGGGWDVTQAQRPLTVTHGGHTFGFVGCNPVGPPSDWATADRPGSAPCDFDLMHSQIRHMRERGVIPIVTLQYWEFDRFEPTPQQVADFRGMVDAGAVIVSGSQAHHPQTFDFHQGVFIHYGLGNLFFDQMQWLEYRREFIDRHVFYDGRHISTEVLTAMLEDFARPRPMTPEERQAFLKAVFEAGGW